MFFYEGQSCPVCHKAFKETDDIVACPICGAPHHRECWNQEGHCHFEADHGTERQYQRPDPADADAAAQQPAPEQPNSAESSQQSPPTNICSNCGTVNPQYAEFCSHCGASLRGNRSEWQNQQPRQNQQPYQNQPPYQNQQTPPQQPYRSYGEYTPYHMPVYDAFGGVPHDAKIGEDDAEDYVAYVGPNSQYYTPKFKKIADTRSGVSWNWAAFFLTPYWTLFRKNYLAGGLVLLFRVISTVLSNYLLTFLIGTGASSYADLFTKLEKASTDSRLFLLMVAFMILQMLDLLVRILFGLFGNYFYYLSARKRIRKLKKGSGMFYKQQLSSIGGTSFLFGALPIVILQLSAILIGTFIL